MTDRLRPFALGLAITLGIAACGASASQRPTSTPPGPSPVATPLASSTLASGPPSAPSATDPQDSPSAAAGAVLTQPWATASLADVRTGQPFRVADLVAEGKVVFVEPMAIWCSKCRDQQRIARDAFAGSLDEDAAAVWIGLDVELSESAANLAKFAELNDFPFRYAVSNVELSRALAAEFGDGILSPPNVNVVVITPDGTVRHMTGQHSAEELVAIAAGAGG